MTGVRTPIPDPSPIEGEGSGGFAGDHHVRGAVGRARRLRKVMTLPEKLLWKELGGLGLHIRRQAPIGRYVADFASHAARLVVEVDGARHDLPDARLHDLERDAWLKSQGYRVLRFRNDEVIADASGVAEQIRAAISPIKALPLDGGGLGGGADASGEKGSLKASPTFLSSPTVAPSPTLPPSANGKGE
jgi:very-short-patch-repair endonuclease